MKAIHPIVLTLFVIGAGATHGSQATLPGKVATKPLFRDTVYDGAADPVLCWNRAEEKWFMFYTSI